MENHQNTLPTSSSTNETNHNDRNRAGVKRKAYDSQETEKQKALQRQKSVERLVERQAERREKYAEELEALRRQEEIELQTESEGARQRWDDAESEAERRANEFEELMRKILKTGDKERIIKLSLNEFREERRAKNINDEEQTAMLQRNIYIKQIYKAITRETEEQTALRELINAERDAERREIRYKDLVEKILKTQETRRRELDAEDFCNQCTEIDAMKRAERRAAQAERLANETEEQRALRNLKRAELEAAFEKIFREGKEMQDLRKKFNDKFKPSTTLISRRRSV